MKKYLSALLAAPLLLAQPASAQQGFQDPTQARFSYAVKFVCSKENGSLEEGLLPGVYGTAINVHNPSLEQGVVYFKKFVKGFVKQEQGEPTEFERKEVRPNHALEVECIEIMDRLGGAFATATGFVVFLTRRPLDITAVYTAGPLSTGEVASIDVEPIRAKRLPQPD
jgi:hypothetical protein